MWLVLAVLVSSVFGESPLNRAWNMPGIWDDRKPDPIGFHIREWKFGRCASEQWTDYAVNITNIAISPDKPKFPGPIFFHVTMDVKEDLPHDKIDLDLEVRKAVGGRDGKKEWKILPCEGWTISTGYDGIGSCRYCNALEICNQTVVGAVKYVKDCKILKNMKDRVFHGNNNLCPPPKGKLTMTFSRIVSSEDLSNSFIERQYTSDKNKNNKWVDVCKYHLQDKKQKCIKGPYAITNYLRDLAL